MIIKYDANKLGLIAEIHIYPNSAIIWNYNGEITYLRRFPNDKADLPSGGEVLLPEIPEGTEQGS